MTLSNRCGCSDKLLWCAALLVAITAGQMPVTVKGPEFLQPLENHTVTQGRDVYFTCVVNHLSDYKVAWIKSDSKAILAIHTHMVAHNPRLSVTHNGHNTWKLHVSNVQRSDSGTYMCQINTDPMQNQMGHLSVVVSPDIIDDEFPADGYSANEGGSVRLRCRATGVPEPAVSWRREDNKNIVLRHEGGREKQAMWTYENDTLLLTNIQRSDMGAYMCIASNNVPPSVSKRFIVQVHFHPVIKVSQHVVAAPVESDVTIQCYVETSPRALNSWSRDTGEKLIQGTKYKMIEVVLNDYSLLMNLTIRSLHKSEFGGYICSSQNVLGKDQGLIRLQELDLPVKTTTTTTPMAPRVNDMVKPRTKPPHGKDNLKKKKRPPKGASGGAGRGVFDYDDETGSPGGTTFPPRYAFEPKTTEYVTTPPWISLASGAATASIAATAAACLPSFVLLRCL